MDKKVFEVLKKTKKAISLDKICEKLEITNADERTEVIKTTRDEIMEDCRTEGEYCGALIQQNGWKVPADYPLNI